MMPALRSLYFFLIGHPLLLLVAALLLCAATARVLPSRAPVWRWGAWAAVATSGGMFLVFGTLYFIRPGFLDHVEAQVAAVASLPLHGGNVYHVFDGSRAYALGYGPALYGAVGTCYRVFGESLLVAKLPALFAVTGGLLALFTAVRRLPGSAPLAGRTVAGAVMVGLMPFAAQFWTRADPLLYGCVALGLLAASLPRGWQAGLMLGLLAGTAANLKLHGGVYFLPLVAMLAVRHGAGVLAFAAVPALGLLVAPFLPWTAHGLPLLGALRVNAGHGFSAANFEGNLEWAALFAAPAFAPLFWRTESAPPLPRELRWGLLGLGAAYLIVCGVAAKPGAGNWHLLPLIPPTLWLAARRHAFDGASGKGIVAAPAIFAWCAVAAFLGWTRHDDWVAYLWRNEAAGQEAEVRAIVGAHPGRPVLMGAGSDVDGGGYRATWVRPVLAYTGQPYTFDAVAIMDLRKAGRPDEICASPKMLGDDPRTLVLIPHGEAPFAMGSYYAGAPCFPESFRVVFTRDFVRIAEGRWFDTWVRSPAARAARVLPPP